MKKLLVLLFVVVSTLMTTAQNPLQTVIIGDTVELRVTGHNGTMQWQQSTDSIFWTNLAGYTDSVAIFISPASPTNKKFYRAEITNTFICENSPWYSSIIRHRIITNTIEVQIGDYFRGGIVFYIDGTGNGLISPQTDQLSAQWGC